jgi:preprotein translocase subunit Sss1
METAKKTTTKVVITAVVLFVLGAIGLAVKAAVAKYLVGGA